MKRSMNPKLLAGTALAMSTLITSCADNSQLKMGEEVFSGLCIACHAAGLNGAPIFGNAKMWGPRIEQGLPTLIEHATNGYGLMPAKGGNPDLTEEQIAAAVAYMVNEVQ